MLSSRTLKWVNRIAYACTVLVAVELIFVAYIVGDDWLQQRRWDAENMQETRTRSGPLSGVSIFGNGVDDLMSPLPALSSLRPDGFRFAARPALGWYGYALSLDSKGDEIEGTIIVTQLKSNISDNFPPPKTKHFTIPRLAYTQLMTAIDRLAMNYAGDKQRCFDPIKVAFEHVRPAGIISGEGNAAGCGDNHYMTISRAVLGVVRQYAALDNPPTDFRWAPDIGPESNPKP